MGAPQAGPTFGAWAPAQAMSQSFIGPTGPNSENSFSTEELRIVKCIYTSGTEAHREALSLGSLCQDGPGLVLRYTRAHLAAGCGCACQSNACKLHSPWQNSLEFAVFQIALHIALQLVTFLAFC